MVTREDFLLDWHYVFLDNFQPLLLKPNLEPAGPLITAVVRYEVGGHLVHMNVSSWNIFIATTDPLIIVGASTPLPKVLHFL